MPKFVVFALSHFFCVFTILWFLHYLLPSNITAFYNSVSWLLLSSIVATAALKVTKREFFDTRINPRNKAVLITGCDSGFGQLFAKRLHSRGFYVFAGCLDPAGSGADDLRRTTSNKRVRIVGLDVTKDDSVQEALNYVKANLNNAELWAVVNNAGVMRGFDLSLTQLKNFYNAMEVNAFGVVRVTKAFLPLIQSSRGRIVTVASLAGRICFPHIIPYTMSKFAAVAFSTCLRQEMRPWGVKVISIEPEEFMTNMTGVEANLKLYNDVVKDTDADTRAEFGEKYFENFSQLIAYTLNWSSYKVHKVIDVLDAAVTLEEPSDVYQPCRNSFFSFGVFLLQTLPIYICDLAMRVFKRFYGFTAPKEAENSL